MAEGQYAHARYAGDNGQLFWLAFRTGLLTLVTLGIYRFWAKTRIRRYIWSAVELDGSRFEYTGTGLEKFLGFLMAVIILAVYLGVIQIVLFYFGISLFGGADAATSVVAVNASVLAVLPFVFFAVYRARRYRMARTRWRGIRFGMDRNAWGYALRAMGYWALTLLTLGLMLPLQTFRLEQYMTDRTWFGDARFRQEGHWTALYGRMRHVFIGIGLIVLGSIGAAAGAAGDWGWGAAGIAAIPVGAVWLAIGVISYRVQSFAYLARTKVLDEQVGFHARPETSTVILTWIVGSLIVGAAVGIFLALVGGGAAIIFGGLASTGGLDGIDPSGPAVLLPLLGGAMTYILVFVAAEAGGLALITQPILKHYVDTLTVIDPDALGEIRQRAADKGADAEGFADALDIGGAI
ncbi:DUF898 family protein [Salipiger mucosus]|uniref:Thymidylate kinase n=1 Tax=Salipiger mucosus DSM 16094 TaxID=1123237 RepID=S9S9X6_9RHOB|nr:DUF898 family protein [Salipiger mucosus]EPX76347.1 Thymidylate kinase [Salipiger mucosus DSM 16094]EPX83049.1 Thymidylate kinase [Salipiger mucosus DSM 16094]